MGQDKSHRDFKVRQTTVFDALLDSLPSYVSDLPFLVVRRMGQDKSHRDFKVSQTSVFDAPVCLRDDNHFYSDVHLINMHAVSSLPDGVPEKLLAVK